jgi:hypothetical protein
MPVTFGLEHSRFPRIQSVGHDIYINGRLFAWLLRLKEPRFVTGYSGPEVDLALQRGEIDARANIAEKRKWWISSRKLPGPAPCRPAS